MIKTLFGREKGRILRPPQDSHTPPEDPIEGQISRDFLPGGIHFPYLAGKQVTGGTKRVGNPPFGYLKFWRISGLPDLLVHYLKSFCNATDFTSKRTYLIALIISNNRYLIPFPFFKAD